MEETKFNEHNKEEHRPSHTTEHIINRTMINMFGCGRAVSAHVEKKKSKLDYALPSAPSDVQVAELERLVNDVIGQHLDVTFEVITQDEAAKRFDMKRLPDGASEMVRVVKIGDYDECLCIGQHVGNTSEIGTFKVMSHSYDAETKIWRLRWKVTE